MQLRIIGAVLLTLLIGGCSSLKPFKSPVAQGIKLTNDKISKLEPGMSKEQVRYLLGTPNIKDPFDADNWYYVYTYEANNLPTSKKTLLVHFDDNKLASISGNYDSPAKLQYAIYHAK